MLNKNMTFLPKEALYVCAPMVDQSELPFRLLCRKYGSNLCYTPMLHSKMMITNKTYKSEHFTTCQQDRPLVAQLCGNDPQTMVKAAKMIQDEVDAIDINFGCPQGIAKKGHYGSFLLQQPELVYQIVKALSENIKVPIFCKIRILKTQQKTFNIVDKIISAGCNLLTVHGRTKQQNKERVGQCDWKMIKKIKQYVDIPVIANGGVFSFEDVSQCLNQTDADGVMSAQSLLQNPALFSGKVHDLDQIAMEYLELAKNYKGASTSCIRAHLFKILYKGLSQNVDLRQRLARSNPEDFQPIVRQLKQRRVGMKPEDKLGWYFRHWKNTEVVKDGAKIEQLQKPQNTDQNNQIQNLVKNHENKDQNIQLKEVGQMNAQKHQIIEQVI